MTTFTSNHLCCTAVVCLCPVTCAYSLVFLRWFLCLVLSVSWILDTNLCIFMLASCSSCVAVFVETCMQSLQCLMIQLKQTTSQRAAVSSTSSC